MVVYQGVNPKFLLSMASASSFLSGTSIRAPRAPRAGPGRSECVSTVHPAGRLLTVLQKPKGRSGLHGGKSSNCIDIIDTFHDVLINY